MSRPPEVSVITTTLNCESFLAEAIESVLAQQTEVSWELLLVDDGSEDRSRWVAKKYAHRFPEQIFFLEHARGSNRGISASRNLGLRHARGSLTAFLDADDVWLSDKLQRQVSIMRAHPQVAMTYASAQRWYDYPGSDAFLVKPGLRDFVPPLIPADQQDGIIEPPALLEWYLVDESMTPCTCTVIVRTDMARSVGGFVDSFTGVYDDQIFYAKVALRERVLVDSTCVARYRQHSKSCCALAGSITGWKERRNFLKWLERYSSQLGPVPPHLREILSSESRKAAAADLSGRKTIVDPESRGLAACAVAYAPEPAS